MSKRDEDGDIGLGADIPRRDFLNGVLVGTAAIATASGVHATSAPTYPPKLDGLRGSHVGSFEVAHALAREGAQFRTELPVEEDGYDLVIVGAGISGLAAAFFHRERDPSARVLIIDNHDDFGGHAKRNEFVIGGRTLIGYGGSQSIDTPSKYSAVARGVLDRLGIDPERFYTAFDTQLYSGFGMQPGIHFDASTFGRNAISPEAALTGAEGTDRLPLSERASADLARLATVDVQPEVTPTARIAHLRKISYRDYLTGIAKVAPEVVKLLDRRPNTFWGLNYDALSALEAFRLGAPGFTGLDPAMVDSTYDREEPYIFHFPDGNAGIARSLVRKLVAGVAPGETMNDVVTAPFDYAQLDRPDNAVRIRLSSTAVRVIPGREAVDVVYARAGELTRVRGKHCILACYSRMIPYLLPELSQAQREAMQEAVRTPLVYTNVVLRNWHPFIAAGADRIYCPTGAYAGMMLDFPVSLGSYRFVRSPDEPIVVHLATAPVPADGTHPTLQFKAGQRWLLSTSFTDMERALRQQLTMVLGQHGFDAARDILAITINRWPHGYAREFNELWDDWAPNDAPWFAARKRFGRIAIAGSDTHGRAYADSAIDAGHRAVVDLLDSN